MELSTARGCRQWGELGRGLLLAVTHGGGQSQELRNKLWGRSFNTHFGLTEVHDDQLLSSQMELWFGAWIGLSVQTQNHFYLRLLQNVVSIMVEP